VARGFSNINLAVEVIMAEGNTVVTWLYLTVTHKSEYLSQAATGNKVAVGGVSIV
jgi:hypothetical protein